VANKVEKVKKSQIKENYHLYFLCGSLGKIIS